MKQEIIIIDDEPLVPALMKEIIEEDQELKIAAIVVDKEEFVSLVSDHCFDAALIDISIGGDREGGLELLRMLKDKQIDFPLVILSAHDEIYYALRCLQAGAKGYINKKYICTDVVRCLKEVLKGNLFVSGEKGENIVKQYRNPYTPVNAPSL